jgi:hypothetical protein
MDAVNHGLTYLYRNTDVHADIYRDKDNNPNPDNHGDHAALPVYGGHIHV